MILKWLKNALTAFRIRSEAGEPDGRRGGRYPESAGAVKALHGLTSPAEFNVTKEEFKDILMYAKELRNRYAALQFFYDMGVLEELADDIIEKYMK